VKQFFVQVEKEVRKKSEKKRKDLEEKVKRSTFAPRFKK
jgi:hypothetical protein